MLARNTQSLARVGAITSSALVNGAWHEVVNTQ
jgi:hypothetical protein